MKEQKKMIHWIKKHKTALVIAGISIGSLILLVLGIRNKEKIVSIWDLLKSATETPSLGIPDSVRESAIDSLPEHIQKYVETKDTCSDRVRFRVSGHIRNLPDGWNASPQKIDSALKYNIILMDGQTWVDSYLKGGAAA